jgi:F-box-like
MGAEAILPTEILLEIFRQALPHRLDERGRFIFQKIRAVSSRWRMISFSSPELWSSLSVRRDLSDGRIVLDRWFLRSGTSIPLELEFVDGESTYESTLLENELSIIALTHRYQNRWRYLSLTIQARCFWDCILSPPSTNWVNLHTLKLWMYDVGMLAEEEYSQMLEKLASLPSLQCLLLEDEERVVHQARYGPKGLTELHLITNWTFRRDHLQLISGYVHLTTFTLSGFHSHLDHDDHVTLHSLSTFRFTTSDSFSPLDHFTTPALVNLMLASSAIDHGAMEGILTPFLSRCSDALRSVSLSEAPLIAKALLAVDVRPSVTRLTLDCWPFAADDNLAEDAPRAWCPHLRELEVTFGPEESMIGAEEFIPLELNSMKALASFLSKRHDRGHMALERLTIRKRSDAIDFPYEFFNGVPLGKLYVMVKD